MAWNFKVNTDTKINKNNKTTNIILTEQKDLLKELLLEFKMFNKRLLDLEERVVKLENKK